MTDLETPESDETLAFSPFPRLPPPPDDPGEYLTHFGGDITDYKVSKQGALILEVTVHPADKYLAMPLTDIRGRRFAFTVYAAHGRKPLVADSTLAVYQGKTRRINRGKERQWRRLRSTMFAGTDDE